MLHGECVSVGMILEAEGARQLGHLGQVGLGRLARCRKAYILPVSLSDARSAKLPGSKLLGVYRLLDTMKIDKKNSGFERKIVLLARIGKTVEQKASGVLDSVIAKTLSEAAKVVADSQPGAHGYAGFEKSLKLRFGPRSTRQGYLPVEEFVAFRRHISTSRFL
ncbi:hypothetical protein FA95DRAFT_1558777 [Auriscalpium vulgare]|uniref:Uncharacterized protein n=1 Tax=Auriscalpium vulgare TaxID=40419 RepID=A0ACB8RUF9_9AGAM|nr:hypothetical protein FA95DRAFT_1558777 [Auriscalpium vulgare]